MKFLIKFINRIIGLKYIKFTSKNILLFEFPMFLIPVKTHHKIMSKLVDEIGFEKTREIYLTVGKIQGVFAVNYFKQKYNIHPTEKDLTFYLEQITSMGLGNVKFLKISPNKEHITLCSIPSISTENNFYDFYLEGIVLGGCEGLFEINLKSNVIPKSKKKFIYKFHKINIKKEINSNYKYKHLINSEKIIDKNLLFEKIKKTKKDIFYTNDTGTYFDNENYFFALLSVYISIYYYTIIENKKLSEIFFKEFSSLGEKMYENYEKYTDKNKKIELFSIISILGFENIKPIIITKNNFIFEITESNFEKIAHNLFPNEYDILNNDIKIGLIYGIYTKITNNKNIKLYVKKINSKKIRVEFENLN